MLLIGSQLGVFGAGGDVELELAPEEARVAAFKCDADLDEPWPGCDPSPAGRRLDASPAPCHGATATPRTGRRMGMGAMDDGELRRGMVDTCRKMNATGLNQGTSGNLSARADDGFLVTPTSTPYDAMEPDQIVAMGFDGTYAGPRRPSSEWRFHRDILATRSEVGSVLHCHPPYATTLACHHREIPAFHYMIAVAGGPTIRCAPYATFGSQALSEHALRALEGRRACLLGQHGMIALGATPAAALALTIEVETLARQYLQALTLGEPPVLPDDEIERVIAQMRRLSYGQTHEGGDVDGIARPRAAQAAQ